MAVGVFLNAMIVGTAYASASTLYASYPTILNEPLAWTVSLPSAALYGSVVGGMIVGVPESLILAFPLAAILGRFRTAG